MNDKTKMRFLPFAAALLFLSVAGSSIYAAEWINGQIASVILGQTDGMTTTSGVGSAKFDSPNQTAVDRTTGKVFVADLFNNRVLRFASTAAATTGGAAEAVFGQPDFTTNSAGTSSVKMNFPQSIFVDSSGRLWVADVFNNRVLRFDAASTKTSGAAADGVLGQADFTSGAFAVTAAGMSAPRSVFVDAANRLWVCDADNQRVLRFESAASKANGATADGVLGQTSFTTNAQATTQSGFDAPLGVFGDANGRLWVVDAGNNRILRFDNAASKANGGAANGVLGQTTYTTATGATTQSGLLFPVGVTVDSTDRLYVADAGNNRILIYNSASSMANGAAASNVLGQTTFTDGTANSGGISSSRLSAPRMLFYDESAQVLYAGDGGNNRVLRYAQSGPSAALTSVGGRVLTAKGRGIVGATVTLTDAQGNVKTTRTNAFGFYRFADLAAGETYIVAAAAKAYIFSQPTQIVNLSDEISDMNFVADLTRY